MRADFARVTFDPTKSFLRVLQQQGRVQLEAEFNEQVAILLHYIQTLAADVIGPFAGPQGGDFRIGMALGQDGQPVPGKFSVGFGRYYVDGILCENPPTAEPRIEPRTPLRSGASYLVYLDVWERLITAVEDESIREVALGGPDTTARSQVVWQARGWPVGENDLNGIDCADIETSGVWEGLKRALQPNWRGQLKAKAMEAPGADMTSPCLIPPQARYRGAENQLYRVEVHRGGSAWDGRSSTRDDPNTATFKWSRDNGSVVFPVQSVSGNTVTLANLGRDVCLTLQPGDWVEYVYDDYVMDNLDLPLCQVQAVDAIDMIVTLDRALTSEPPDQHPLLRRWDQTETSRVKLSDGTVPIQEMAGAEDRNWIPLEDGVRIQFQLPDGEPPNVYRTGDYWLIPARTATGDVEWPGDPGDPQALPPRGYHHYAPLAWVSVAGDGAVTIHNWFRRIINRLWTCESPP